MSMPEIAIWTAVGVFALILVIVVVHYVSMFAFLRKMWRKEWTTPVTPFEPKAAVILTLRGADPSLSRCVEGVLRQKYRDYTIFFAVDHLSDPALPVVEKLLTNSELPENPSRKCEIVVIEEHLETCALKCNSLVHVISTQEADFEVVALLDADTRPSEGWLRQLVEPLSDSRFSATSGLRWYVPERDNWGSLIRMLWNVAAVNQMVFSQIPWGGSLAIRRNVFFEGGLLERWKYTFTDDVSLLSVIYGMGKRVMVTPSLLMLNRETCRLSAFYPWVKRQLMMAKLYHPKWGVVVGQAFFLSAPLGIVFALGLYGLRLGNGTLTAWSFGGFALYILGVLGAFVIMDGSVRKYLRTQGESVSRQTVRGLLKTMISIALTQIVYTFAICGVFRLKNIAWRGVWYRIGRSGNVQLVEYIPYAEVEREKPPVDSQESL